MIIREMLVSDIEGFYELEKAVMSETKFLLYLPEEYSKVSLDMVNTKLEKMIKEENKTKNYFIAEENGKIVGFIDCVFGSLSKKSKLGYFRIAVLKDYRGQGIAKKLIKAAEDWMIQRGVIRIEISTFADNTSALSLYKSLGYKVDCLKEKSIYMDNKMHDEYLLSKII